jgi:hypothetical protein
MPKKPLTKLRPDLAENAHRVFLESIGELPKTLPPDERTEKNPEAVARGKKGGRIGGRVRAVKLAKERRSEIARAAGSAPRRKPGKKD